MTQLFVKVNWICMDDTVIRTWHISTSSDVPMPQILDDRYRKYDPIPVPYKSEKENKMNHGYDGIALF